MKKLKIAKPSLTIAYFGTPSSSAWLLEKILTDNSINRYIEVKLVVTQPDKPVGKKQVLTPSPVKLIAQKYKINLYDKPDIKEFPQVFKKLQIDLALVVAFGFKTFFDAKLLGATQKKIHQLSVWLYQYSLFAPSPISRRCAFCLLTHIRR